MEKYLWYFIVAIGFGIIITISHIQYRKIIKTMNFRVKQSEDFKKQLKQQCLYCEHLTFGIPCEQCDKEVDDETRSERDS